jgi:hypothetical protein
LTRADTIVSQPGSASQSHARVALDVHPGPLKFDSEDAIWSSV